MPIALTTTDLSKRYGETRALALGDLQIAPGERVGLVGNNGAGKTTLLRLALDLIRPTTGHVQLAGVRVGSRDESWKRQVGAFLDSRFLVDYLRPREYFRFVAQAYGVGAEEADQRLARYTRFLGPALDGGLIRDLSLGNAAKVGIVGAMLPEPGLIVLDEPFANLDPGARIALEELLREESEQRGATALVSSHDLDHVVGVCTRVLVLAEGRLVRDTPSTPDTRAELRAFFASGGLAPDATPSLARAA